MATNSASHRIVLPATMASVAEIGRQVVELTTTARLPPDCGYRLRLATEEIVTNIVVHGYQEATEPPPAPDVTVELGFDDRRVWVRVSDCARPFDPTLVPAPADLDLPLAERAIGGLGIYLARTSVDEFTYERSDGRNNTALGVRRTPPSQQEAPVEGAQTFFVVGDRSQASDSLLAVLQEAGVRAELCQLDRLPTRVATRDGLADTIIISSALSVAQVRLACETIAARLGTDPRVFVYAETTPPELEPHVRAGWDYLVPPFDADVLRRGIFGDPTAPAIDDEIRHLVQYEKELEIGREIQSGFLPDDLPEPEGWQIEVRFHPARQVAGDFYDAFDLVNGRRIGFVVADVCDKGVGAALFMALIRSLLRNTASHTGSLSVMGQDVEWEPSADEGQGHRLAATAAGVGPLFNAVTGTDRYMVQNHLAQGYFATVFFGMLDPATGAVIYINCGHNPPVVRRSDGRQVLLNPTGPALGMLDGSTFRIGRVHLELGDLLYIYTDGVTEAKNERGAFFTERRMRDVVADSRDEGAGDLLMRFDDELREHIGDAEQFDDITMMALYRSPDPSSAIGSGAAGTAGDGQAPGHPR